MKAIVIGAGIGGLSAAIAIRKAGWDVEIYEQAEEITAMGAAISIWPNAVSALDEIGCAEGLAKVAEPLESFALADFNDKTIAHWSVKEMNPNFNAYLPTRTALQNLLLNHIGDTKLHLGHKLNKWLEHDDRVDLFFENEVNTSCDLFISADGIWSSISQEITNVAPSHAGYGGMLALGENIETDINAGTEYWGNKERFGLFKHMQGTYWFYMQNEDKAWDCKSLTKDIILERLHDWPLAVRQAIVATDPKKLIPFSIHAKPVPKKLGEGRIICVGDAAHPMEPNMGQGACQAIEDAVALGQAMKSQDIAVIQNQYKKLRLKRVRKFVNLSTQSTVLIHKLPYSLMRVSLAFMRHMYKYFSKSIIKKLYTMPSYNMDKNS